jgi:hypothetical protein
LWCRSSHKYFIFGLGSALSNQQQQQQLFWSNFLKVFREAAALSKKEISIDRWGQTFGGAGVINEWSRRVNQ